MTPIIFNGGSGGLQPADRGHRKPAPCHRPIHSAARLLFAPSRALAGAERGGLAPGLGSGCLRPARVLQGVPMKFYLIALLLLAGVATAQDVRPPGFSPAPDTSVYGIQLGQPLQLPECRGSRPGICYERTGGPSVLVHFPVEQSPRIVKAGVLAALLVDGRVEGIGIDTPGISTAEEALQTLQAKYGEPHTLVHGSAYNRLGAKMETVTATWHLSNLTVRYESVARTFQSGLIQIDTPIGNKARAEAAPGHKAPAL